MPATSRARRRKHLTVASSSRHGGRSAVVYARVSSSDQEREGFSIPAQQRLLRTYAASQGYEVVEEFVDVETAKRAGRTHFARMLQYLRRNAETCNVVLVEKTDRLYRNLKDWVTLDEMNLEIHLVKEGSVLGQGARSSDKFMHGIRVLMAKNYIDNLSEEAAKGMREKAQQGIWPTKAPLGYRNARREDGKKVLDVDPVAAPSWSSSSNDVRPVHTRSAPCCDGPTTPGPACAVAPGWAGPHCTASCTTRSTRGTWRGTGRPTRESTWHSSIGSSAARPSKPWRGATSTSGTLCSATTSPSPA